MATRSLIGMENPRTGRVKYIYCHSDGYILGVGRILQRHYNTPDRVEALFRLGNLSELGPELGEQHSFDTYPRPEGVCTAYFRDRGPPIDSWQTNKPRFAKDADAFSKLDGDHQYLYLRCCGYSGTWRWYFQTVGFEHLDSNLPDDWEPTPWVPPPMNAPEVTLPVLAEPRQRHRRILELPPGAPYAQSKTQTRRRRAGR